MTDTYPRTVSRLVLNLLLKTWTPFQQPSGKTMFSGPIFHIMYVEVFVPASVSNWAWASCFTFTSTQWHVSSCYRFDILLSYVQWGRPGPARWLWHGHLDPVELQTKTSNSADTLKNKTNHNMHPLKDCQLTLVLHTHRRLQSCQLLWTFPSLSQSTVCWCGQACVTCCWSRSAKGKPHRDSPRATVAGTSEIGAYNAKGCSACAKYQSSANTFLLQNRLVPVSCQSFSVTKT